MAKIDKEALAKNKFWIGLGAFVLLWMIGFLTLRLSAGTAGELKKKDYENEKKLVQPLTGTAKNRDTFLPPWQKYGKMYSDHKDKIWEQAWESQKGLLQWPSDPKGEYARLWNTANSFDDWKKQFTDETGGKSSRLRSEYGDASGSDFYLNNQFKLPATEIEKDKRYAYVLEKAMAPVEFKGGTAGFATMMCPATGADSGSNSGRTGPGGPSAPPLAGKGGKGPPSLSGGNQNGGAGSGKTIETLWGQTPLAEEIWLAQEDYSVKAELLQVVRRTLDAGAHLTRAKTVKEALPEKMLAQWRFRNSQWEITLYVAQEKTGRAIAAESKIKNVSRSVQLLSNPRTKGPLVFRLTQGEKTYDLTVSGEPLQAGETVAFGRSSAIDTIDLAKEFELTQVFDWSASPVRRIDDIRLGYHSHRTAITPLVASKHFPPPVSTDTADASGGGQQANGPPGMGAPPPGGGGPPPGGGGPPPGMGGQGGGNGGAAAPAAPTVTEPNKLVQTRYLHVTGQARSLPFAMTLIVEQNHIADFLTELANSQLRVQITQVSLQHVRDVVPQTADATPAAGGPMGGHGPMVGGGPPPGPGRPPPLGGTGPKGMGNPGSPGGTGNPAATVVGPDPNLVELTVYGIATLYEKFPVKKEEPKTDPMNPNPMPK